MHCPELDWEWSTTGITPWVQGRSVPLSGLYPPFSPRGLAAAKFLPLSDAIALAFGFQAVILLRNLLK